MKPQTIFVVISYVQYEGYDEPRCWFDTEAEALLWINRTHGKSPLESIVWQVLEIDKGKVPKMDTKKLTKAQKLMLESINEPAFGRSQVWYDGCGWNRGRGTVKTLESLCRLGLMKWKTVIHGYKSRDEYTMTEEGRAIACKLCSKKSN